MHQCAANNFACEETAVKEMLLGEEWYPFCQPHINAINGVARKHAIEDANRSVLTLDYLPRVRELTHAA